MGGLHLPHWKVEHVTFHYSQTTHGHAIQYTYQRAMAQLKNTSMHLLKLNSRVPRTSLGSSFQRDLLYMAAKLAKMAWEGGYIYMGFYTGGDAR